MFCFNPISSRIVSLIFLCIAITIVSCSTVCAETCNTVAPRYSLATNLANSYSPGNEIAVYQLSAAALYDYDAIWPHQAPEQLRFKVEASAGVADGTHTRAIISANMLALYFIDTRAIPALKPYIEAGIGAIYTDYQIEDQGLRFNFNPLLGVGTEIQVENTTYFIATRLHHISNGGLHHDNRGTNSIMLQIGRFF